MKCNRRAIEAVRLAWERGEYAISMCDMMISPVALYVPGGN